MISKSLFPKAVLCGFVFVFLAAFASVASGQSELYKKLASTQLTKSAQVSARTIKVDRVTLTLNGTLYFGEPTLGQHTLAVFVGNGTFNAPVPESSFEKAHVRRMLKADLVESDFTSAVFRLTDGSLNEIGARAQPGTIPPDAVKLAAEHDRKISEENGINLASRLAVSVSNNEEIGFFFASFRGGKLKDFSYVLDHQNRIPTANFDLNGGEKGLIFNYKDSLFSSEVLMAFYSEADYKRRIVQYSDMNDLVDIDSYDMEMDLRSPKSKIGLRTKIGLRSLANGISAVPFLLGEGLSRYDDERKRKQLRVRSVTFNGSPVDFVQGDWDGGFTIFLPSPMAKNATAELDITMDGDFLQQPTIGASSHFSYPRSTTSWYPRHGYLDRAKYKMQFVHGKSRKVACVGERVSEIPSPEDKDLVITQYVMDHPIALASFAIGPFVRHKEVAKWDGTEVTLPLEFNSVDGAVMSLKESFILAELSNSVRYFHKLFGNYPYKTYSASFHPYGYGQGFPSMLLIPGTDNANKNTYSFIAHETAHQWWGNIVAWRSYRDQWLSEGFAEYSGILYTGIRDSPKASVNLIDNMRANLRRPPETMMGQGKGRLNDVGPIILGHRLSSSKTFGGYQSLVYDKGALVLRMLHYMFTDPSSGNGDAFFAMMRDFVEKHRNGTASTDDFRLVANQHFVNTPLAKRYGMKDLNWFFGQWVYETHLPSYTMEYAVESQPDGSFMLKGNVIQENVPENFFMPLPVVISFGGDRVAMGSVAAAGPKTPFNIKLPNKPQKVQLDPNSWILSEKTSTK